MTTFSLLLPADFQKCIGTALRGEQEMPLSLGMPANFAAAHGYEIPYLKKIPYLGPSTSSSATPKPISPAPNADQFAILSNLPSDSRPSTSNRQSMDLTTMVDDFDPETPNQGSISRSSSRSRNSTQSQRQSYFMVQRSKTSFQLAHPPPTVRHKQAFGIKPRILLQLQQLSDITRPTPALDVVSSTYFAPALKRNFPRIFRGKDALGSSDLVIVTSDRYNPGNTSPTDRYMSAISSPFPVDDDLTEHKWDKQIIGTICKLSSDQGGSRGKAEICLNHGDCWEATPLLNGSYEFISVDEHGIRTIARWVLRKNHSTPGRRRSNTFDQNGMPNSPADEKKFNFSIVNPECRRHPIIASMGRQTIDVLDRYPSQSSSMGKHPPCAPVLSPASEASADYFDAPSSPDRVMIETDDHLRTLIVITGIWVAFRENWSQNFSYSDAMSALGPSSSTNSSTSFRSLTMTPEPAGRSRSSTPDRQNIRTSSLTGNVRQRIASAVLHRRSSTTPSPAQTPANSRPASSAGPLPPQRTNSNGKAFMEKLNHRHLIAAARRASQRKSTSAIPTPTPAQREARRVATPVEIIKSPPPEKIKVNKRHTMHGGDFGAFHAAPSTPIDGNANFPDPVNQIAKSTEDRRSLDVAAYINANNNANSNTGSPNGYADYSVANVRLRSRTNSVNRNSEYFGANGEVHTPGSSSSNRHSEYFGHSPTVDTGVHVLKRRGVLIPDSHENSDMTLHHNNIQRYSELINGDLDKHDFGGMNRRSEVLYYANGNPIPSRSDSGYKRHSMAPGPLSLNPNPNRNSFYQHPEATRYPEALATAPSPPPSRPQSRQASGARLHKPRVGFALGPEDADEEYGYSTTLRSSLKKTPRRERPQTMYETRPSTSQGVKWEDESPRKTSGFKRFVKGILRKTEA
ncbi:MAG: hypothetical protein M1834_003003 [Cirrosporium novae-zelandiae]|nr:MAG: hypothetical protein M1834_003003 [Cirrosporium novae-zelandiae]